MLVAQKGRPPGSAAGERSSDEMHARVTTLEGAPDKVDDGTRHVRERLLPQMRQHDGFEGFVILADRQSGKMLAVTLWEDEEALRQSEEAMSRLRGETAQATATTVAGVNRYDVTLFEMSG
jgi:heme-degrading monooxygenase HmoA